MNFFSHWPIRRLLIFLVILSILPALGIIVWSGAEQRRLKTEEIQRSTFSLMQAIANRQQVVTESSRQFLITLSGMPEVQRLDSQACDTLFRRLLPNNPIYSNIFMMNKEGTVLSSAIPTRAWNFSDRKFYRDAVSTRGFSTGEYRIAQISGWPVFHFSYPILGKEGDIKGVLAFALDLRNYDHIMAGAKLPEKSVLILSDHKGVRLYRYPKLENFIGRQSVPELTNPMMGDSEEGIFSGKGIDDVKRLYAYKRFRLSKDSPPYLYMRLGLPEEEALQEVWSMTRRNLIVLGFLSVLALASAWYIGNYLVANPIRKLVDLTERFARGERGEARGLLHAENELGHLAAAFDKMSADIKAREDERDQREKELKVRQEQFESLTNSAPDAIFVQSDGRFVFVNPAMLHLMGASHPDEMIGRDLMERIAPEYRDTVRERIRIQRATGKPVPAMEQAFLSLDGSRIEVETTAVGIPYEGKGSHLVFVRDITERKLSEEEIRRMSERLELATSSAKMGIWDWDIVNNVLTWDDRMYELYGINKEDFSNAYEAWLNTVHPDDRAHGDEVSKQALSGEIEYDTEFRVVWPSGEVRILKANGIVIRNEDGVPQRMIGVNYDITERRLAEKERQREEREKAAILDGLSEVILEYVDPNMRIIWSNAAMHASFGKEGASIIGKHCYEVVQGLNAPCPNCTAIKACQTGEAEEGEVTTPDGRMWFTRSNPIKDDKGQVTSIVHMALNVTERKRAEEEYRTLFTEMLDGFALHEIICDDQGNPIDYRFLALNPAFERLTGLKVEDLLGRTVLEVLPGTERYWIETYGKVAITGEPAFFESYHAGLDKHFTVTAYRPAFNQFACIFSDITERKRAEGALQRKEHDLRESQRIAHVGSWHLDVATNQVIWTEELYRMYGFDPSLPPPPYTEHMKLFAPESWERLSTALAHTRDTGIPYTLELETVRKDGSNGWMWVRGEADIDSTGKTVGLWGAAQDITERKRSEEKHRELEERLQRSEKMEALGLLAGGVAHDLNNALGILVGYSELLYDGLDTDNPFREDAKNIIVGGEQAAAIVQDLLTLARRGVQTRTVVNLNRIVTEYLRSPDCLKLKSLHPDIRIRTELDEELIQISGSKAHLSKSLINLVSNAAEAMPAGGEILIRTENRYLDRPVTGYDELQEGDYVVLSVSDEGEGINDEDMKRIFEPFYTKKVMGRSGTGLGLSVVWGTVKDHDGYIDVQSDMGKGTTFYLYFPVTQEETKEDKIAHIDEYMGRGETILVVDDVKHQRDLANRILSRLNYRVETAGGGEEAVEYLKTKEADLIVLDMIMDPGIDGFETYRRITEFKPKQKAIIVSGFAETERVKMAQALGGGAFVRKPYIRERIGLAVRKELDRK